MADYKKIKSFPFILEWQDVKLKALTKLQVTSVLWVPLTGWSFIENVCEPAGWVIYSKDLKRPRCWRFSRIWIEAAWKKIVLQSHLPTKGRKGNNGFSFSNLGRRLHQVGGGWPKGAWEGHLGYWKWCISLSRQFLTLRHVLCENALSFIYHYDIYPLFMCIITSKNLLKRIKSISSAYWS